MNIDWNDDEAVVRAAWPNAALWTALDGCCINSADGHKNIPLGRNWNLARRHPTVVAFEHANRPVQEAPGDGFEEWYLDHGWETGGMKTQARAAWTACAERKL